MRSSMTKLRSTKKFEIVLDSNKLKWFYMSCAAALPQLDRGSDYESERHRFESYTPHQLSFKPPETGAFPLRGHCGDSNLVRGASVKKTRSVFSERASPPAGGRSRCGSAQRMRGILYAAPIEIESLRQRGLFFYAVTAWIRTSVEARASRKREAFLASGRGRRQAGEAGADPRSGCAESYTPHQSKLKASGNGGFYFMAVSHGSESRSRRGRLNHHFVKFFQIVA